MELSAVGVKKNSMEVMGYAVARAVHTTISHQDPGLLTIWHTGPRSMIMVHSRTNACHLRL